jgi:RES domain-containing protein
VTVYRIGSSRHPANDGKGASLYPGRWNHEGTPVAYCAESRALCALEILVNEDELADDYVSIPIEIPDSVTIKSLSVADLLPGWDSNPVPDTTRDIGTDWAKGLATAVLSVPPAVIPRERNYILNPAHPDFARIRFATPEPFYFDDRLGRLWEK